MTYDEAIEWLSGKRSMCNLIPQDPFETWQVRIAQADAAQTEQAYCIVKASAEKLLPTECLYPDKPALPTNRQDMSKPEWQRLRRCERGVATAGENSVEACGTPAAYRVRWGKGEWLYLCVDCRSRVEQEDDKP